MPLRLRLALFGAAVVALALLLFGVLLYSLLARSVNTNQDAALKMRAADAAHSLSTAPASAASPAAPLELSRSNDVFLEVTSPDGTVLYTTGLLNGAAPGVPAPLLDQAQRHHGAFATKDSLRLYAVPISGGYVVAGQSTRVPKSNLSGVVGFLVISAVPSLLAALIASWLVAGRALRPLKQVASAAEDIGRARDFGRRLPLQSSRDEVATLAASFNGMLAQLQDAFESQQRFVADASHELRTPLTTIQANAGLLASRSVSESVHQAAVADMVQETERMTRLIDRLLTLARADAGLQLNRMRLDLKPIVDEVCRQAANLHGDRKLSTAIERASVLGDEDSLRQLTWILLENAFRFAKSEVEVRLTADSGWARLIVADDGPGIPVSERDHVFERFYRVDASRTGPHAGVGLSIAKWIVAQHHGRIVAGEANLGGAALLVDLALLSPS